MENRIVKSCKFRVKKTVGLYLSIYDQQINVYTHYNSVYILPSPQYLIYTIKRRVYVFTLYFHVLLFPLTPQ